MTQRVTILGETLLAHGRFPLTRTKALIEDGEGERRTLDHEVYRFGRAAAVLLYERDRGLVRLVKQFRLAAFLADGSLDLIEACAGMLDDDEPEVCAKREAFEETGVRVTTATFVFDAFTSPGGLTETIACFLAPYSAADCIGPGGGVDEDERIEVLEIPFEQALAMIDSGEIRDAKTIALLYCAKAKGCFGKG